MYGELLVNVLQDWILFGLIEGILYCKFYEKICNIKKFRWYEILILSIGNATISQMFPIIIYQSLMIYWMGFLLNKTKKVENIYYGLKFAFLVMLGQLITEMPYAIIYEFITKIDLTNIEREKLFTIMISIRIVQIIFIYGGVLMKGWLGTGTTRK